MVTLDVSGSLFGNAFTELFPSRERPPGKVVLHNRPGLAGALTPHL